MNIIAIIILAALIFEFALQLIANLLNLKSLKLEPPSDLKGIYKIDEYRKSQQYLHTTTRFGLIVSSYSLILILAFWFLGGFNWLDQLIRTWSLSPLVSGLLYIGILAITQSLLSLPFSIYHTFIIEERFGFNRTTPKTFVLDRIKSLVLFFLLGGSLLSGILALFQYAGTFAWIYCWIAVVVFSLVMQYIAPTWIMPLFNKFIPMQAGELKEAIFKYARSVNFPLKNVFVMDGSKRSSKSNAFFTGFGGNKRIALFDTLIEKHAISEMVAILAHEIGHYKKKHILQGTIIGILHTGIIFFLLSLILGSSQLYQAFFMEAGSIYTGLIFFSLLYTPIELILSILMQIFSRKNEHDADRFAVKTIDDPNSLVDALKKLSATSLSNLTPHPFYVFLNYSHPPLLQRILSIQSIRSEDT